ncbi:hypothetical protein BKA58DRAFT_421704 [Alternaria rosae]|uniref:uncharacterized protein n=1 Tax=Alternaria rosae TaxID=1187941 RepID=UPI001E8EBE9C|nr:uncharacterized protein BKA58DRAFT_421704 [Alternaria rosae]KAH6868414.1 hypothetical protein BKA58DRAFT_421704 [Alternaria rosae]
MGSHVKMYTTATTIPEHHENIIQPNERHTYTMPYHPDSTSRALFMRHHIHTPTALQEILCSICRQRCTDHHQVVQITAHPECQCVFGETCLLQWLGSGSAACGTCPTCRAVLFNGRIGSLGKTDSDDDGEDSDDADGDEHEDSEEDETEEDIERGRQRSRQKKGSRPRRRRTPSSASSLSRPSSSAFSSDEFGTPPPRSFHRRRRSPSPSPSPSSSITSHTLSAPSTPTHTLNLALAIDTLVTDLWAGTWDLVTESWSLTPDDAARSRSITRAQLVMLVRDVNPFEEDLEDAVVEHLVVRARRMVVKHRRSGEYDDGGELRAEREDIRLAVGYGV